MYGLGLQTTKDATWLKYNDAKMDVLGLTVLLGLLVLMKNWAEETLNSHLAVEECIFLSPKSVGQIYGLILRSIYGLCPTTD